MADINITAGAVTTSPIRILDRTPSEFLTLTCGPLVVAGSR